MHKPKRWKDLAYMVMVLSIPIIFLSQDVLALNGVDDQLEAKMNSLTTKLTDTLLPAASILGLVYAVIMALFGDEGGKKKIIAIVSLSIIGFLAKYIITFFQTAVS